MAFREASLGLAPEGSGPKVRIVKLQAFDSAGVPAVDAAGNPIFVDTQVIVSSDEHGFPVAVPDVNAVVDELKKLRHVLVLGFAGMGVNDIEMES